MHTLFRRNSCSALTRVALLLVFCSLIDNSIAVCAQQQQEKVDLEVISRIKDEEAHRSQIMEMVGYLTDVIGPRLTGSPNIKKAQAYAKDRLKEWGVANAHLEAWGPFGRGWSLEDFTASMTAPTFSPLIAYPRAWSPSTNGSVRGNAVYLDAKAVADLDRYKGKLKGKIVLLSPALSVAPNFQPQAARTSDEELLRLANAEPTGEAQRFQLTPEQRAAADLNYHKWQLAYAEGAAVVLTPGRGDAGTVYVTSAVIPSPVDVPPEKRPQPWDISKPTVIPQAVIAAEQYNRIIRLLTRNIPVELQVNIKARFYEEDPMSYNVIAEVPGTDLKDEVVMIGGCIDSWHAGTGATDNAAGAAVALEVLRIIKALGLKPRRTIRIGLWSAEELGRFGSRAYVASHFARSVGNANGLSSNTHVEPTPEYEKFAGYFNLDYGTGKIRGIYLQGNESVRPIFRAWLAPFKDLGATTLSIADIGATDHVSFDEVGLPGFQFIRDFMEANTRTGHTNMDVYDHVLEDDLKQSAVIAASLIYHAGMRDEKLPRKPQR